MSKIRKHYEFYGRVQGVGFRYRAYYAANELGVTGRIKNRYDGSVEMEAEGEPEDLENLILQIEKGRYVEIENFKEKEIPLKNDRSFEIIG